MKHAVSCTLTFLSGFAILIRCQSAGFVWLRTILDLEADWAILSPLHQKITFTCSVIHCTIKVKSPLNVDRKLVRDLDAIIFFFFKMAKPQPCHSLVLCCGPHLANLSLHQNLGRQNMTMMGWGGNDGPPPSPKKPLEGCGDTCRVTSEEENAFQKLYFKIKASSKANCWWILLMTIHVPLSRIHPSL